MCLEFKKDSPKMSMKLTGDFGFRSLGLLGFGDSGFGFTVSGQIWTVLRVQDFWLKLHCFRA